MEGFPCLVKRVPPFECGKQVAGRAREDVDGQYARRSHQRLGQQAEVPQAPHVCSQVEKTTMHKHGGNNANPLAVDEHGTGVGGAPWHELTGRRTHRADAVEHHGDIDCAVDANQEIGSRSRRPGRTPPANWWRRRRERAGAGRQKFRASMNSSLFMGWRSRGITSHDSTLKHFRERCRMGVRESLNTWMF